MEIIALKDIKEFPSYVEHFGKFYSVVSTVGEDANLPPADGTGASLNVVSTTRKFNVYSQKDYAEVMRQKLQGIEESQSKLAGANSNETTAAVAADSLKSAKAAVQEQLAAASAKK